MRKTILLVALAATLTGCAPVIIAMTPAVPPSFKAPSKAPQQKPIAARGQ